MHENSNGQIRKWHLTSSLTSNNPLTLISCISDPQLLDLISFLILNQNSWFKAHFKDLMARNIMQVVNLKISNYTSRNHTTKSAKIIHIEIFRNFNHAYFIKLEVVKLQNHSNNINEHEYKLKHTNERLNFKNQSSSFLPQKQIVIYCLLHSRWVPMLAFSSLSLENE